jgi:hypothetical protein
MTSLFELYNISPDDHIIDYLPSYWIPGPHIEEITFRHLLNHTSGLTGADIVDFSVIKSTIRAGISLGPGTATFLGHYDYQNVNYALCRILLAVINGNISRGYVSSVSFIDTDSTWDLVTFAAYQAYTVSNVFRPSDVFRATLTHPDAAALAYNGPFDSNPGWNSEDLSESCGCDGWHLSINELLNVMGEFRRGRGILSPESAQQMLDNGFGVDPLVYPVVDGKPFPAGLTTAAGEFYCKNGRWYDSQTAYRREEQCLAYFLPHAMELAMFVNSPFASSDINTPTLRDMVTDTLLNNLTIQFPDVSEQ